MQSHGPKRIYTPQSLEFWFTQLERNWEEFFTPAQLEAGHRIYRDGEVRELELTPGDAIIHRRVDKRDEYTVVECGPKGFTVRSSTEDADSSRALAVAGLHEIEELVADEISPLPETAPPFPMSSTAPAASPNDKPAPASGTPSDPASGGPVTPPVVSVAVSSDGNGHSNNGNSSSSKKPSASATLAKPAAKSSSKSASATEPPPVAATSRSVPVSSATAAGGEARTLLLSFTTRAEGLAFEAHWVNTDGTRTPALGVAAQSQQTPAQPPSSAERAKLIGLSAYARKAHFVFSQDLGAYVLASVAEVKNFLKTTLPAWNKLVETELCPITANLLSTSREITIEAVAVPHRRGASNLSGGLDLRWIFRAGEHLLSDDEVALVTRTGGSAPAMLPGVGIVTLPVEKLASVAAWQRSVKETRRSGEGDIPPYLLFSLFNDARLTLTLSSELEAWRQSVLERPASSPDLPAVLRPYQRRGVEWLHHLCDKGCHGLLADEMGLGKTLQIIALLMTRPVAGDDGKPLPTLVVCPASVVPVWCEEIERFWPGTRIELLKNGNDFNVRHTTPPQVWIASFTQLRKHRALLDDHPFGYAVLDEGQFIKNPDAKVTQTCFAIRARHRIVLTGTPLENRQLDLWSIFRYLLPGLLGTRLTFEAALATDHAATMQRLRTQLAPFILRRTKDEVAQELPPKVEMELISPLTEMQRTEYARICAEGLQRLGDDVSAAIREKSFGLLALLTRLRQVCCDPDMLPWIKDARLADSGKISLLIERLAEVIANGHKVVIFSQFVMLLNRVRDALAHSFPDLPRYELTGMTLDRLKPVQGFQNADGAAAMLVSLKAAGTGITLHSADYVFLLDPWWNPAVEAQAVDRVHRIGQTSTVFVYRMVTAGTIEERIEALKASKRDLFDKLIGGLGGDFDLSQHFSSLHELVQLTTGEVETEQRE
ncbi:DEAD/DEAH box helicase [Opitutaceae bacterium TAV4]|nr:DEAD/DEAH box helicase [Opitutaceae bacterium TAV4]RRK01905.1 DEAD/DEAH box helicase [Opitutaceae bacterium TAV3]